MKEYRDYDELFPELVYDIVDYFRKNNRVKPIAQKSVFDFCANSRYNEQLSGGGMIQPDVVNIICQTLEKKGVLMCIHGGNGLQGDVSNYLFMPGDDTEFVKKDPVIVFRLNCLAYGFRYIYNAYRDFVLPVVVKKNDTVTMGTCFRFRSGIVTAKHCIEADEVWIPGFSAEKLNQCQVFVSTDEKIDMAYIECGKYVPLIADEAKVLDEVLVMGYPKIPMFFDFLAAERATVSSIPTRGAVASLADQFISRNAGPLMLVTARVRGGNSGGPIIDANGAVVGMAFVEPASYGDYDEMGYGIAYPIGVLNQLMRNSSSVGVNFVDRIEG